MELQTGKSYYTADGSNEPQSVVMSHSVVEKLKSMAQAPKSWNDIHNARADLAREVLKELNISWDK